MSRFEWQVIKLKLEHQWLHWCKNEVLAIRFGFESEVVYSQIKLFEIATAAFQHKQLAARRGWEV
jgi:hypothetical protein